MLLVDTNVLLDVLTDDPLWADWSIAQLRAQAQVHALAINPIVYAELSIAFERIESLDEEIDRMALQLIELTRPVLFLAGKAWLAYRRSAGTKQGVLPDFLIGAQAAVLGCPVLTRDPRRIRSYFPGVAVLAPAG